MAAISTVKFTLNGTTYNLTYDSASGSYKATLTAPTTTSWNVNSNHTYNGTVTVTDTGGNVVTATVTDFSALGLRVLEKVEPVIAVTYPTAGAYITTNKPAIKWTVTDTGSGIDSNTIALTIDSGTAVTTNITKTAVTNGYSCTYTPTAALSEGSHTIKFTVSDNDGNAATATSVTFKVDTVPPTLNVTAPTAGLITNNPIVTVSGTTNDATSSPVSLTVNGKAVAVASNGTFSTTVTLPEGANTITIIATDSAGKSTTVTRSVTVDTKAPVITSVILSPNPVDAGATYIITVTATDS